MKEQLQFLLDHWDYEKALDWFMNHVEGKFFVKNLLSKGADPYNIQKLKEELYEVLHSLPEDPVYFPKKEESTIQHPKAPNKSAPKVVRQAAKSIEEHHIDEDWKPLYKESSYYHAELSPDKSDEENLALSMKILDNMEEVQKLWEKRDFVRQYGVSPDYEFQGLESLSIPQLITRRNTLRSYISKAKKGKLNAEKIPEWEAQIAEVERRLKP